MNRRTGAMIAFVALFAGAVTLITLEFANGAANAGAVAVGGAFKEINAFDGGAIVNHAPDARALYAEAVSGGLTDLPERVLDVAARECRAVHELGERFAARINHVLDETRIAFSEPHVSPKPQGGRTLASNEHKPLR